ncbi:MAG TPA: hypothetical protein VEX65_01490, partial [Flavisolibacter sp.]|nr:hypothetical protein [Flavisolibacter sp.]
MKKVVYAVLLLLQVMYVQAQKTGVLKKMNNNPPALSAIREGDLKRDLTAMASDHFRGREAGTLDELRVSMWWAEALRKEGLEPADEDGTYFQYFNL